MDDMPSLTKGEVEEASLKAKDENPYSLGLSTQSNGKPYGAIFQEPKQFDRINRPPSVGGIAADLLKDDI